jgi:hypothetical protein
MSRSGPNRPIFRFYAPALLSSKFGGFIESPQGLVAATIQVLVLLNSQIELVGGVFALIRNPARSLRKLGPVRPVLNDLEWRRSEDLDPAV